MGLQVVQCCGLLEVKELALTLVQWMPFVENRVDNRLTRFSVAVKKYGHSVSGFSA